MSARRTVGFLHTAEIHVGTFDSLVASTGSGQAVHFVDVSLLNDARAHGITEGLRDRISVAITKLQGNGAQRVICSCTTIANAAEEEGKRLGVEVVRTDRPLVIAALALGTRILLAASLPTALETTLDLFATETSPQHDVVPHLIAESWAFFESGDLDGYARCIAQSIRAAVSDNPVDAIVLAQASMSGAIEYLSEQDIEVLTSPPLAVAFAFAD